MAKAIMMTLLAVIASASADPQYAFNTPLSYSPAVAAYTAPAGPAMLQAISYPGPFPFTVSSYAYGQSVNVQEYPVAPVVNPALANPVASYTNLPYTSLPLTSLSADTYPWNYVFRR